MARTLPTNVHSATAEDLGGPHPATGAAARITALLTAQAQLDALLLDELAAFVTAGAYVDDGTPTAASWLRVSGRLGRRDASGTVHHARALRELTVTTRALSTGSISRAHAAEIVKGKERSHLDAESFRRYEEILVELAEHASPDEVRAAARHLIDAESPDRDKELLDVLADRFLTLRQVGDLAQGRRDGRQGYGRGAQPGCRGAVTTRAGR